MSKLERAFAKAVPTLYEVLQQQRVPACPIMPSDVMRAMHELDGLVPPFFTPGLAEDIVKAWKVGRRAVAADGHDPAALHGMHVRKDGAFRFVLKDDSFRHHGTDPSIN